MHKEGTWKISTKGTRDDVVKSIDADATIPTEWKAALKASLPAVKAVRCDAHCHFAGGKHVFHADIATMF